MWPALRWQGGKARLAERVGTEVSVSGSAVAGRAQCRKRWRQVGALAVWGWGRGGSVVGGSDVSGSIGGDSVGGEGVGSSGGDGGGDGGVGSGGGND
eukprot:CAMPEP_0172303868 /NCGR_PEP_ID=MMETSP1058-20130122/5383_1 /TAXON_ID=83371 /ORGANISM="Detonula confervacea, Strain CCMP 353" /LENGTH=96 /DNA_ID=CAMNT_0013014903 /DNA_START=670 /DNA_END=960 /DNA_ORIENTATION=+